jgi:hypothetical protein
MKIFLALALTTVLLNSAAFGQDDKALIADGTAEMPVKYALQPTVEKLSAREAEAVKNVALATQIAFDSDRKAMSSEETVFRKDFELLDAAEGFFIYREIRFRAYLYKAYSQKMRRNYQGIVVLRALENRTKFETAAHYVYEFRGDRYLRQLPDINGNLLSELAVFSAPPMVKGSRKFVSIIEFSPGGLEKIGAREIYAAVPQKQLTPQSSNKSKPAKRVYIPAEVTAIKLYAAKEPGKPIEFYEERWRKNNDFWGIMDKLQLRPAALDEDKTGYVELVKPIFPKGPGEK